jgi:F0F1-type ATP synthase assembly protein I
MAEKPDEKPPESGAVKPARKPDQSDLSSWFRMTGLGVEFIVAVGLMGAVGWYADKRFDSRPWLTLVGVGVGFAVGLYMIVREAMKSFR